jgi:processive 1,2-diacylglycerol beta-glucosyltransferase
MMILQENAKLNILIVSASIGAGHHQAALALESSLRSQAPAAIIHTVDFMSSEHSLLNAMLKHTYVSMLNTMPDVYDSIYRWSDAVSSGTKVRTLLSRVMKLTLQELVELYRPNLLFFTHPFPCGAAAALKRDGRLRPLLAAIITDFTVHRMWVYPTVDSYFVPTRAMRRTLAAEGIEPSRVLNVRVLTSHNETRRAYLCGSACSQPSLVAVPSSAWTGI